MCTRMEARKLDVALINIKVLQRYKTESNRRFFFFFGYHYFVLSKYSITLGHFILN